MTSRLLSIELAMTGTLLVPLFAFIGLLSMPTQAQTESVVWYVDGSCTSCGEGTLENPLRTIAEALAVASDGETVLVAQGTYTENLLVNAQVTIMGGYSAQRTAWTRDIAQYETTVASGDRTVPGDWNGDSIGSLSVVKDDHAYRMWYSAGNEIDGESIGYADSPDGLIWFQPYEYPLLQPGPLGAWDEAAVTDPSVLSTDGDLQMWYVGLNVFGERAIGHATSQDALTWHTYDSNPVLGPDSVDAGSFGFPTVIQDGATDYKMWYSGGGSIWLATSSDGLNWTKHLDTPALTPGPSGEWDSEEVYAPVVVANEDRYEMWYVGAGTAKPGAQIGHASSSDGLIWTKSAANPVLVGQAGYWEEATVAHPMVVVEGPASYSMWYRGGDEDRQAIGQTTSDDGLNWERYDDNPVLTQGRPTHWGPPVVYFGSESDGAVLDGLTVTHGYSDYGGGIFAYEASPTIRACRLTGNAAHYGGGGIWLGSSTSVITNTVISDNTSTHQGGGILISYASPTIQHSQITGNMATNYGGGLLARGHSQPVLVGTTIADNSARWGGGLYVGDEVAIHISDGRVAENSAEQAAGMRVTHATLAMTNTFVVDNRAVAGEPGGMQFWYASGRLVNATIANNTSDGLGGVAFGTGDPTEQLFVLNSILFFNGGRDLSCSGGICSVTYSDVQEGIAGSGNISADPQFADPAAGDYRLRGSSPAIDAGTGVGAPCADFEGDRRPAGGVDMGADEFTAGAIESTAVFVPLVLRRQ